MINSVDNALHYLTGKQNIDAITVEELEKLVNDHPYFPVAHFLLSKKLKKNNLPNFLPEVQKTALYFPNPYWLHYQLLNDLPGEPVIHDNDGVIEDEEVSPLDNTTKGQNGVDVNEEYDDAIEEAKPITNAHPITTTFSPGELAAASMLAQRTLKQSDFAEADVEDSSKPNFNIDDVVTESKEELTHHLPDAVETEIENVPIADTTQPHFTHNEIISQPEEEMAAVTRDTDASASRFLDEMVNEKPDEVLLDEPIEVDDKPPAKIDADDQEMNQAAIDEAAKPEEDEHEKMFQNIKAMLDASSEEANADVKTSIVPIDPYYTIDYFAAQGIKLDLTNPQDKLGKQVKKFTQWLKHMKKLGPEDSLASDSPSPAEVEAQQIADASNIAREVVTEAMATVLEKQGKKDKAIQLYRKLTFLNPHKSAYFADKINNLNSL